MQWLTTRDAVALLGVKPATLYAYVSRGLISSRQGPNGRSRFSSEEVERLRGRGNRVESRSREVTVESGITSVSGGEIRFRNIDSFELAAKHSFEEAAHWLWSGIIPSHPVWRAEADAVLIGRKAQAALPAATLPLDRLRVTVAAVATSDPLRYEINVSAVPMTGERLISALVDSLPLQTEGASEIATPEGSIAGRLWDRLSRTPATPELVGLLDDALVILMDHELSFSTLSARLAASTRSDPYSVVAIGLSALAGPLQSVACLAAEDLLAEIESPDRAVWLIGERLRRGERLPGFGHSLYDRGDPRGTFLLERLNTIMPSGDDLDIVRSVVATTRERGLPAANVDFALAALARGGRMVRGASEAIFAIARTAGWIAHAMEEYSIGVEVRPRMIYMGPPITPER
ncbi:MAG TPA: citrate/2-methylcitrate synthase [Candidatus Acidoferrum sp.]|jgi:citrate synthase|nr:citrate/2-methylcitrate synthase [Candidatus Acidoferrum sp.]